MATQYWICDFCGHQEESEHHIKIHEDKCDENPNNQQDIDADDEEENDDESRGFNQSDNKG